MDLRVLFWASIYIVLFLLSVSSRATAQDDSASYQCYDCIYYRGVAEMNPNCKEPQTSAPVSEDCDMCSVRIFMNENRTFIQRMCTRFCEEGRKYPVVHHDLQDVMSVEHCCTSDLCNGGATLSFTFFLIPALLVTIYSIVYVKQ